MSRLDATRSSRRRRQGRPALIPYVTAGDPALGDTVDAHRGVGRRGRRHHRSGRFRIRIRWPTDLPFSGRGSGRWPPAPRLPTCWTWWPAARSRGVQAPIVLLAYYNCVLRKGEEAFVRAAADAGADGLIVPDLPPEEAGSLRRQAEAAGVDLVPLAAPTSTDARLALIGQVASGFIYCVSVTGVTGARPGAARDAARLFGQGALPGGTRMPVAVGFGISDATRPVSSGAWPTASSSAALC